MPPNAPAPWMMFVLMFVLVSVTLGLMILVAGIKRMARGESFWIRDESTARPSPVRLKPRRRLHNAVTKPETKFSPRNEPFKALTKEVTPSLPVTSLRNEVTETDQVSTLEAALIAVKLSQQVAPSTIAKQLPGYTPGRYKEFSAKVQVVKAALEAAEAQSLAYQPLVAEEAR